MKKLPILLVFLAMLPGGALAQKNRGSVKVSPNGVNVNSNGATTVFLSFGGLGKLQPAESYWCGELIPAAPDIGLKCDPATIYGSLPSRYDQSRLSGTGGFTDIMSIPPSVARRAYQDARDGSVSSFYYVRRFIGAAGEPDEYIVVTCRMANGGAGVPFALTSVKLSAGENQPVVFVKPGERLPPFQAEIIYNGSGRLVGRWEIVTPSDEPPSERDLLTEATLPVEERAMQKRYTQIQRINLLLPPTGRKILPGPDPARLPTQIEGQYLILLRIEVSEDKDGGSNLAAVGAGAGFVQSGAVAGFPMPALRYVVGAGDEKIVPAGINPLFSLLAPADNEFIASDREVVFSWSALPGVTLYRIEIVNNQGESVLSALLKPSSTQYRLPEWIKESKSINPWRWRVSALNAEGAVLSESAWRNFSL